MFCENCGNQLNKKSKFCENCGNSIFSNKIIDDTPEELLFYSKYWQKKDNFFKINNPRAFDLLITNRFLYIIKLPFNFSLKEGEFKSISGLKQISKKMVIFGTGVVGAVATSYLGDKIKGDPAMNLYKFRKNLIDKNNEISFFLLEKSTFLKISNKNYKNNIYFNKLDKKSISFKNGSKEITLWNKYDFQKIKDFFDSK